MSTFYRADDNFGQFLTKEAGLTFHNTNIELEEPSPVKYFTDHKSGKQIKIDSKNNTITFLDEGGYFVEESHTFTDNEVFKFLNN